MVVMVVEARRKGSYRGRVGDKGEGNEGGGKTRKAGKGMKLYPTP